METPKRSKVWFSSGGVECAAWHYVGTNGADTVKGGSGNDKIKTKGGDDTVKDPHDRRTGTPTQSGGIVPKDPLSFVTTERPERVMRGAWRESLHTIAIPE